MIIVCHALYFRKSSCSRKICFLKQKAGWWDKFIGDGKAIDTTKYFVICSNNIGSSYGSTSPMSIDPSTKKEYRLKFPVLAISDIVKAQMKLYKRLGNFKCNSSCWWKYGGMQALCYAIEHPTFAKHIIALATTAYTRPWAIAFNKIAIEAIRHDPIFKMVIIKRWPKALGLLGLAIGRMAGLILLFKSKFV